MRIIMVGALNHDVLIRVIAIAYNFDLGMSQAEVSRKLDIHKNTLRDLFNRVRTAAQSDKLSDLLQHLQNTGSQGPQPLIPPGSPESVAIREAIRSHKYLLPEEAVKLAPRKPLQDSNVDIPSLSEQRLRSIRLEPAHCSGDPDSRPIVRKRALFKVTGYDPQKRLKYVQDDGELHQYIKNRAIFIFTDEKKFSFGGTGHQHASVPQGQDVYYHPGKEQFVREQWAAACAQDVSITRPHAVWSKGDKKRFNLPALLAAVNKKAREAVDEQRHRALNDPTSPEAQQLHEANRQIAEMNNYNKQNGLAHRKQRYTPARLWRYADLKDKTSKLGFCWYGFRIYEQLLFPYYTELRERHPGRQIVIVEDNSSVHLKARRMLAERIQELGIVFANHPAISPDLNMIETLHCEEQKLLQ